MKGNNPRLIALSKPIIDPKYPTPKVKIITEPINKLIRLIKYVFEKPLSDKIPITTDAKSMP